MRSTHHSSGKTHSTNTALTKLPTHHQAHSLMMDARFHDYVAQELDLAPLQQTALPPDDLAIPHRVIWLTSVRNWLRHIFHMPVPIVPSDPEPVAPTVGHI
jgi:hypothetical protein